MSLLRSNDDGLVEHYGTRGTTGAHKLGYEREREYVEHFEDFVTLEADFIAGWTSISGTDAQAVKVLIVNEPNGVYRITSGNADGTAANDLEAMVAAVPINVSDGGVVLEARIRPLTNVATMSMGFGVSDVDVVSLEEPVTISGTTITTVADDFCGFVYDTAQTTDQWYCVGVSGGTDATGNAISGVVPVAATWQTLRVEIDSDGEAAQFFINDVKVGQLTANAVASGTDVFLTVWVCSTTTTSKAIDVDYLYYGHNRS